MEALDRGAVMARDRAPMKERGILFSAPMVRALLAGKKTVTRRIVKTREPIGFIGGRGDENDPASWGWFFDGPDHHGYAVLARGYNERHDHGLVSIPCPYGDAGDRLWVRETWRTSRCEPAEPGATILYAAELGDYERRDKGPWKPGIHMFRWASRITLEVTSVRVERLHDITEEDAIREGVNPNAAATVVDGKGHIDHALSGTHLGAFACLWDEINGESAPWASDPWVWRVEFKRVQP